MRYMPYYVQAKQEGSMLLSWGHENFGQKKYFGKVNLLSGVKPVQFTLVMSSRWLWIGLPTTLLTWMCYLISSSTPKNMKYEVSIRNVMLFCSIIWLCKPIPTYWGSGKSTRTVHSLCRKVKSKCVMVVLIVFCFGCGIFFVRFQGCFV